MSTPIIRSVTGTSITRAYANTIATGAYCNSADAVRVQQSALSTAGLLLFDARLTGVAFSAAPTAGSVQLAVVDRDASGNIGPTPTANIIPNKIYTFGPLIGSSNASTGWIMGIDSIPIAADQDLWLFNNGTGVTMNIGSSMTLTVVPWSPGT